MGTPRSPFPQKGEVAQILRQQRIRERQVRREQEKEDNHWNFLAGALVAKYLKDVLNIPVYKGADAAAKNAVSFTPLENILVYLAGHKEFTARTMVGESDVEPDSY